MSGRKNTGPMIGSASAPMISSAGKDHIIFSKKLIGAIALTLIVTGVIFFSVEQSKIQHNMAVSRVGMLQNSKLKEHQTQLEIAKSEIQQEEDEFITMYDKWLAEDSEDIKDSKEVLEQFRAQLKDVTDRIGDASGALKRKEKSLEDKEGRLKSYQFKIQQKQGFLDQMADVLEKVKGVRPPVAFHEAAESFVWDDEVGGNYDEETFYADDEDWLNDEEWY